MGSSTSRIYEQIKKRKTMNCESTESVDDSHLTIVLDSDLKPTVPTNFSTLTNQLSLDTTNPENYYSEYEHTENLIDKNPTGHHLINAFLYSYNNHLPLKLRPDDIQLVIQSVISTCVNNNSEKFRSMFVAHEGKMELKVKNLTFDPDFFCNEFKKLMRENVKDSEFVDKFASKYSTSTHVSQTVSNMMLMNTLKEYFSYEMMCMCGIPSVMLCGTQEDWISLFASYNYFEKFFEKTELDDWFKHFDILMDMFLEMRMLKRGGIVADAPTNIKELWKRVISYVPQGSGGDQILDGWVRLFIPYTSGNTLIGGLKSDIKCLDISKKDPSNGLKYVDYGMQDVLKDFYIASGWSTVPKSVAVTPAVLDYNRTKYEVEFVSGFFNSSYKNGYVCANIGYKMTENKTMKDDNLKLEYTKKGVKAHDNGMVLDIPRVLRSEADKITKIFHTYGYNLYGTDPVEEENKKKYLDQGVKYDALNFSDFDLHIPPILASEEKEIRKVFGVSRLTKTVFH
jgi:hypothetical protein